MTGPNWEPRRLTAVKAELPEGVTPPGTRGRILHAALRLFAEYGFHGTSIRDLARATEINSATLYAHYAAKEDILAELIALGHVELYNGLSTALRAAGPSASERLVALVRAQVHMHADYPLLAVVANNEMHALSPEKAAPALSLREQARQLLYRVLHDGVCLGRVRDRRPDARRDSAGQHRHPRRQLVRPRPALHPRSGGRHLRRLRPAHRGRTTVKES